MIGKLIGSTGTSIVSIDEKGIPVLVNLSDLVALKFALDPIFNADRDVFFYVYTKKNPIIPQKITNSVSTIKASKFESANPTQILIHGFLSDLKNDFYDQVVPAYLSHGDYNVVSKIL